MKLYNIGCNHFLTCQLKPNDIPVIDLKQSTVTNHDRNNIEIKVRYQIFP